MTKNEDVSWMIMKPKIGRVSLKGFTTEELVTELIKRDDVRVEELLAGEMNMTAIGPCKIIVVKDK